MLELLKNYSLEEIVVFIVLLALALKGVVSFFDWGKERIDKIYRRKYNIIEEKNNIEDRILNQSETIQKVIDAQVEMQKQMQTLTDNVNLLIKSDKDDIKAWITEKHHYFCYELGYIDDYNLDCMEKRYGHYVDENGNSFAGDLMKEVRALPKVSQNKNLK